MPSRLATIAPDLDRALTRASSAGQRAVSIAAAEFAVRRTRLTGPEIDAALAAARDDRFGDTRERAAIQTLAERLDERQWEIKERVDSGQASAEEQLAAFSAARAATALYYALDADTPRAALESTYEANAATDDLTELHSLVTRGTDE